MTQRTLLSALIVLVIVVGLAMIFTEETSGLLPYTPHVTHSTVIKVGGVPLQVGLADTRELWERGLSGEGPPRGMFFMFDKEDEWGIWMKDMHFPIDALWIDTNKKIVHIQTSIQPESYPRIYASPVPARYLLELPSGYVEQHNLFIGDDVEF